MLVRQQLVRWPRSIQAPPLTKRLTRRHPCIANSFFAENATTRTKKRACRACFIHRRLTMLTVLAGVHIHDSTRFDRERGRVENINLHRRSRQACRFIWSHSARRSRCTCIYIPACSRAYPCAYTRKCLQSPTSMHGPHSISRQTCLNWPEWVWFVLFTTETNVKVML